MRAFGRYVAAGLLLTAFGAQAQTQTQTPAATNDVLPAGQMTFVVPLAAGGPLDAAARVVAEKLGARLGRTIIIENKLGAGGNIGAAHVARSKPDGLTWLYTIDTVLTVNPHLYASQGFNPERDLVPAGRLGYNLQILAVNAKAVPSKTFAELLEYGKTHDLNFASAGIGSPGHLAFEYLRMATGIRGTHVPYRGAAPALQDLVSGAVQTAFVTAGAILPHLQTGALRALAVSSSERVAELPDVPTADEAGIKGFESRTNNYLLGPAGTDVKVREHVARHLAEAMKEDDLRKRLKQLAIEPVFADSAQARGFIAADREKWGKVLSAAGVKANP